MRGRESAAPHRGLAELATDRDQRVRVGAGHDKAGGLALVRADDAEAVAKIFKLRALVMYAMSLGSSTSAAADSAFFISFRTWFLRSLQRVGRLDLSAPSINLADRNCTVSGSGTERIRFTSEIPIVQKTPHRSPVKGRDRVKAGKLLAAGPESSGHRWLTWRAGAGFRRCARSMVERGRREIPWPPVDAAWMHGASLARAECRSASGRSCLGRGLTSTRPYVRHPTAARLQSLVIALRSLPAPECRRTRDASSLSVSSPAAVT